MKDNKSNKNNNKDDSPRFKLLECKLCGELWENHGRSVSGLRVTDKCIAANFVDFNRKRIYDNDTEDISCTNGDCI